MFRFTESQIRQKQQVFNDNQKQKKQKIDLFNILDNHSSSDEEAIQTFQQFKDWANNFPFEKNSHNIRREQSLMHPKVSLPPKHHPIGINRKIQSLDTNMFNHQSIGYQVAGSGFLDVIKEDMNRSDIKTPKRRRASQNITIQATSPILKSDQINNNLPSDMKKSSAHSSRSFNGFNQINQYQIREKIGSGAFSQVHLSVDIHTDKKYALKILQKKHFRKRLFRKNSISLAENYMENQIAILKKMQHPFIIKLYQVIADNEQEKTYLVLEYCPNGFINQLKENEKNSQRKYRKLLESECRRYLKQLCLALDYMHSVAHIAHRDIKPENILLSDKGQIRLSDFGLGTQDITVASKSGTKSFLPPEMLNQTESIGKKINLQKSDIWATGITLLMLLTGKEVQIESSQIRSYLQSFRDISEDCRDFLKRCLEPDPQARISSHELLKHPWVDAKQPQQYKEIVVSKQDQQNAIGSANKQILTAIANLHIE